MTAPSDDGLDEDARLAALRRYTILFDDETCDFREITRLAHATLRVPMAAVSLVEFDHQWFRSPVGLDLERTPRAVSFCALAIRGTEPLLVADATADPRFATNPLVVGPPHIRSYLGVPLTTPDGFNIGALCALDAEPRAFTPHEVEVMRDLARIAIDALELRQIANIDALTGAFVRRAFLERMQRLLSADDGEPAALAIVDIDRFRRINEAHGHAVGDQVLRGFARHVIAWKRAGDVFGRIGGEEFALILPATPTVDALKRVEKLRTIVETMGIDAPVRMEVTASIGLAPLAPAIRTPSAWLHAADRALYEAKVYGRNRVVLGDPLSPSELATMPGNDRRRVRDLPVESEILSPLTVMRWVSNVH